MKLLGYRSVNLLDSCSAVASLYAVERVRKGQKKGTTVLFIDIGSENIDCSLWKFKISGTKKIGLELLQYRHSNRVGGRFVDERLIDYVSKEIGKEFHGSEIFTVRNIIRKAKERLAGNKDIGVDLTEDYGKYLTFTQELFANITKDMTKVIFDLLQDIETPDEIELIGGSSRLKVFTDVLSQVFPNVTARRSLNSDEAIAMGAAYYQALKSGSVIGSSLDLKKPSVFGLNVTIEGKSKVVFEPGDVISEVKVKMNSNQSRIISTTLDLNIYDEYIVDSSDFNTISPNFTQCLIENVDNAIDGLIEDLVPGTVPRIHLAFGNSAELDCPDLISATLSANITTTNPRLMKPGHGNTTITERKLFIVPSLIDTHFHVPSNARAFIRKLVKADEDRRNRQESCHKIESFIIDSREKALYDEDFQSVTTEEERKEMIERLEEERTKVDCTTLITESAEELDRRLQGLKDRYEKPIQRLDELVHRPLQLQKLYSVLERADEAVPEAKCDNETLEKFHQYVNETRELIHNVTHQNLLEQPCFTIKDMKDREKELLKKIPELKRPPKKSNVINFSTSDSDDMDDEEYDRLKQAGIMFNRPRKRKHFDIPENQDLKEDLDKERKYFRTFKDVQTNESREFRDSKRAFQSENRDFYRFDSMMRRNETFQWLIGNLTKDLNSTVDELRENLTRMRNEGIARREKLADERRFNQSLANATDADGNYNETLHKEICQRLKEEDIQMKKDREEARRIRQEEEKKKREEEEEERKRKEEEERKKREEEEEERKRKEAERANSTNPEDEDEPIGEPPEELSEEEKKIWIEKRKNEIEAKRFLRMNADSIDDDLKPLTREELDKFDEMKRKFEGSGSKPFENEEDRRKYEEERRQYEQLKRRHRQSPTPRPTKTPKPSETPLPPEWEELADDLKALTDDEERYYNDRVKTLREKIEFEELKKVFLPWKEVEDARKAKEQAEREERQRKREEDRQRRMKEDEERRRRAEEDRQRRMKEEEERRKRREEERERRRIEMEQRRKEQEELRLQREARANQRRLLEESRRHHSHPGPAAEQQQQQEQQQEQEQQQPEPTPDPQENVPHDPNEEEQGEEL
ncbi:hypothetical protein TRFO_08659 [Tritrichomonas foetus]|uniref:DnaK protein n=1 Tax=Tritrichomonas foetus TaxID=1144522 RepID=A0A1J4JMD1_9EUKA|nr:hypothetical protein TRFO_08659 [Tritrichomonas foetus]|eukprot:OHS98693.1 hypothetical protein TRFO_08659 [Tritrichomonas foetus]